MDTPCEIDHLSILPPDHGGEGGAVHHTADGQGEVGEESGILWRLCDYRRICMQERDVVQSQFIMMGKLLLYTLTSCFWQQVASYIQQKDLRDSTCTLH